MLEWNTLSLVVLHENLSDEKGMSCIGFLKPTILVPVFSAESAVLSFYAGFKVEKPHYADFFTDFFHAWAGPADLLLLIGMTFADWVVALQMSKNWERPARKRWLVIGCVINIGLLCIFKYLTFFLQNFHNWFGVPENVLVIALPIGISFYTFQLLSYMVDVYRQEVNAPRELLPSLLLYVSLFHQCIAGPIVRYEHVEHELIL